jgi:hypothetical protein
MFSGLSIKTTVGNPRLVDKRSEREFEPQGVMAVLLFDSKPGQTPRVSVPFKGKLLISI